jgi:hypothetical protein
VWSIRDIPASDIAEACRTTNKELVTIGCETLEEAEYWANVKEVDRLTALLEYNILDVPPSAPFERLTALGARVLKTPICFVSIMDIGRQFFLSCSCPTPKVFDRKHAFCNYTMRNKSDVFVVNDASKDPRFADNPCVTGAPNLRFYAGVPLIDEDDNAIGSFCTSPKIYNSCLSVKLFTNHK